MKILISLILLILFRCSPKDNTEQGATYIDPSPRGYSQAVEYNFGNAKMVFISGQVAVTENGELVGKGDLGKQTEQVFQNIKARVEKAGGHLKDVVKIDAYFTDLSKIDLFRKEIKKVFDPKTPPSCTVVQIERLVNEDFLIEINAIAVVKN
ncbi:MAG: RidA family protein [Bacteroidetes bacterium]|nr:RidA family protein [Bacteroidota bacterium]